MNSRATNPPLTERFKRYESVTITANELERSKLAGPLVAIYARLRVPGSAAAQRLIRRALAALEGGPMRSASLRQVMMKVHGVEVGAHSYGCFDPVRFPSGTRVGRYVSIGPLVSAYRRNHPTNRLSLHPYFYRSEFGAAANADVETVPLEIAAGSWLGANALVLPGCRRIGRGAVVAAGAVLTRDVPDYAIVGGTPASVIRFRFGPEAIAAAESTRWWQKRPREITESHDVDQPWGCGDDLSLEAIQS